MRLVIGIKCEKKRKHISFEACISCADCLPAQIIESLRRYDFTPKRNVYYVREIIGCLRKAYYDRKERKDEFYTLKSLYAMKRGTLLGAIGGKGYNEFKGSLSYTVDGEPVKITAKLDCYDPENGEIIENKTLENIENRRLPKKKDSLQIQCYGAIFKNVFQKIEKLTLLYLDMNNYKQFNVQVIDRTNWMKKRVEVLHRHIRNLTPPQVEESYECKYCPHRSKCLTLNVRTTVYNREFRRA